MRASIFAAGLAFQFANAVVPPNPRPTDPLVGGVNLRGFTPKPTTAPVLPFELRRRAATSSDSLLGWFAPDNTCGYVSGLLGASKTCISTQICAGFAGVDGANTMGCCETTSAKGGCTWFGNCIGSVGYYSSSACNNGCRADANTLKCTNSAKPFCYSYMMPGLSIGFFSCDSTTAKTFDRFDSTYLGQTSSRKWSAVYDTSDSTSSRLISSPTGASRSSTTGSASGSSSRASSGSSTGSSTGSSSTSSNTALSANSNGDSSSTHKTSVGAIAGGVVGGIAVIAAAIVAAIVLILRRKKNTQGTQAAPSTAPGGPGAGPDMSQSSYGAAMAGAAFGNPNDQNRYSNGYFGPTKHDYAPVSQTEYAKHDASYVSTNPVSPGANGPVSPAPPYAPSMSPAPPAGFAELPLGAAHQQQPQHQQQQPIAQLDSQPIAAPQQQQQQPQVAQLDGQQISAPPQQQPQGVPAAAAPVAQPVQQYQAYHPPPAPVELGNTYAVPTHNPQGRPVYEAQ